MTKVKDFFVRYIFHKIEETRACNVRANKNWDETMSLSKQAGYILWWGQNVIEIDVLHHMTAEWK